MSLKAVLQRNCICVSYSLLLWNDSSAGDFAQACRNNQKIFKWSLLQSKASQSVHKTGFSEKVRSLCTGFGVNGEERLPLENAVDDLGTVSIGGIIGVCGSDLEH